MTRVLPPVVFLVTTLAAEVPVDEQSAAAAVEADAAQVDWKGRALTAEARNVVLEDRLGRLFAVVQASVRDLPEFA